MRLLCLAFLLLGTAACRSGGDVDVEAPVETTFDRARWRVQEGDDYPYREQMVEDFLYNDTIRTLLEPAILELLGEPDRRAEGFLYYTIAQKRFLSWPMHTRTLVIKFNADQSVEWIKLHE